MKIIIFVIFSSLLITKGCQEKKVDCDSKFTKAFFQCPERTNRNKLIGDQFIYYEAIKKGNEFELVLTKGSTSGAIKSEIVNIFNCIDALNIEINKVRGIYMHREYSGHENDDKELELRYIRLIKEFKTANKIKGKTCILHKGWFPRVE